MLSRKEARVCSQIVDELPLAQSTVFGHLSILKEAGLVRSNADGPRVGYCIDFDEMGSRRHKERQFLLTPIRYFHYYGNMKQPRPEADVPRYADMFAAIGTEPRLRILRLLLAAHPEGMVVGDISDELGIPGSTLSHHLDKLKNEDLVTVRREGTYLWYAANTDVLQELLTFLYAECCTRNKAIKPESIVQIKR